MSQVASSETAVLRSTDAPQSFAGVIEPFETARPTTQSIAIRDLHPTQMCVGYREVAERRQRRRLAGVVDGAFSKLVVPVVLGPCGRSYILDRHHELCALDAEGVSHVRLSVIDDLRRFEWVGFWRTLERRGWCRPMDGCGQRLDYSYIPTTIDGLTDDPFRSLARALRRAGGYAKQRAPFSDFIWADLLRQRISRTLVNDDFEMALREALSLVRNGCPLVGPESQGATTDMRPKTPGLQSKSSGVVLPDISTTEAARERASADYSGTMT